MIELYRAWEQVVDELLMTVESMLIVDPQRDWDGVLRRLHNAVSTRRPPALAVVTKRVP